MLTKAVSAEAQKLSAYSHVTNAQAIMIIVMFFVSWLVSFFIPSKTDGFGLLFFLYSILLVGTVFYFADKCDRYKSATEADQAERARLIKELDDLRNQISRQRVLSEVHLGN
jgi:uncharacterized membrane-anchored protein